MDNRRGLPDWVRAWLALCPECGDWIVRGARARRVGSLDQPERADNDNAVAD